MVLNPHAARLVEANAAIYLAGALAAGSSGPEWSLARVHGLLRRVRRALARCQPWMPTAVWQVLKGRAAEVQAKVDAFAATQPRAGHGSLPAAPDLGSMPHLPREVPACAACGKQSLQLKKCSRCYTVAYW